MMNKTGWLMVMLVAIFLAIQFIPAERNNSSATTGMTFANNYNVPPKVKEILSVSCYDCHSDNTGYPWYSKVQPGAWFMAQHIEKGKKELNFDQFSDYSPRRKKAKIRSIISQIEKEEMPLKSYLMLHSSAKLSAQEKKVLIDFFNTLN